MTYIAMYLSGRCANGSELDCGTLNHAVSDDSWNALCGAKPGRRSAGWRNEGGPLAVTCPRCLKKLKRVTGLNMQTVLDHRAAAGLPNADVAAATMTEARQGIAASADAMTQSYNPDKPMCQDDYEYLTGTGQYAKTVQDFSIANDAALFAADQYDDWRDWQ